MSKVTENGNRTQAAAKRTQVDEVACTNESAQSVLLESIVLTLLRVFCKCIAAASVLSNKGPVLTARQMNQHPAITYFAPKRQYRCGLQSM